MGKCWDGGDIAFQPDVWREVLRVLKPGGHLLAMGGTRTYHRLVCAIEDAGFEIRDTVSFLYGSGFPKSVNIATMIDKKARGVPHGGTDPTSPNHGRYKGGCSEENETGRGFGAGPGAFMAEAGEKVERDLVPEAEKYRGFGNALKPAMELICLARKPLIGTIVENVLMHGTGGLNIDECRVPINPAIDDPRLGGKGDWGTEAMAKNVYGDFAGVRTGSSELGRWPANVILDGSDEVNEAFAQYGKRGASAPVKGHEPSRTGQNGIYGHWDRVPGTFFSDTGTAARFFQTCPLNEDEYQRFYYSGKAKKSDRAGSKHPTVKPIALMRYLCKLITPPGGTVLDLFAGSGTTGEAAVLEGFNAVLIEREDEYAADIRRRLALFLRN
jgi:site-specific DNA-methyltransferase (adenine-specific)